jgi:hypothetical protein
MSYTGFVTAVLDVDATLAGVDEQTRQELADAADTYIQAPEKLKAAIIAAAARGEKPAAIARAIGYAYTYDYVAKLVREWRAAQRRSRS